MNNYNQIKQLPKYLKVLNALRIGMEVKLENASRGNPQEAPEFIPGRNADLTRKPAGSPGIYSREECGSELFYWIM